MKLNRKWIMVLALVMSMAMATTGTLAYLTDRDSEANVFTMGNVEIDLNEEFDPEDAELIPGVDIEKKPTITNTGKNDAWVWATIAIPAALDNEDASKNVVHFNYSKESVAEGLWNWKGNGDWMIAKETIDGVPYNVYTVLYETPLKPGETTIEPVMTKVYMDPHVDIDPKGDVYHVENGVVTGPFWNINDDNPVIYVSAYAIQTEGFDTALEGYNAYNAQWGTNGTEYGKADKEIDEEIDVAMPTTYWKDNADTSWYDASATKHTVSTAAELAGLAQLVAEGETFKGETITLADDIDIGEHLWTPIGNSTAQFKGTFDGGNNTISNLKIAGNESNVGLFGFTTDGTIKNLTVDNAVVSGYLNVGVLSGTPYTSKYENITVTGLVQVKGMAYVGGVGGKNAYANWTNITVDVDNGSFVKANSVEDGKAYRTYVGGVIGFMGEGGHSFTNVTSNIDVYGTTCDVGGITGIAHYGNSFINCSSSGDVTITDATEASDAEEIGGIAGVWHNGGSDVTFEGCSYTGKLSANITEDVDLSDNTIHGKAYSTSGSGNVIVK